MKQSVLTVKENIPLACGVYKLILSCPDGRDMRPGQFINLRIGGVYLRRPISVCNIEGDELTIVYKVVGRGTGLMTALGAGSRLDALICLGNGFDIDICGRRPVLVGGGVGCAPLYLLARRLVEKGKAVSVVLGFRIAKEIFYIDEFAALGAEVTVVTEDGSFGQKGFATDAAAAIAHDFFYACGPEPMLRAMCKATRAPGELSFEARMGCGFGACMGCSCRTITGHKRICREGPVLKKEELIW